MVSVLKISIYLLCVLTAVACSVLLLRGYRQSSTRLLLWSSVCFGFLALQAMIVIIELLVLPGSDLQMLRHAASLAAAGSGAGLPRSPSHPRMNAISSACEAAIRPATSISACRLVRSLTRAAIRTA